MPKFTVTKDHIALLKAAFTSWNDLENGAPSIDPKYPYGNSWFYGSMAEAMGWPMPLDEDGEVEDYGDFPEEVCERMGTLHQDMQTVLQILLDNCTEGIKPGVYTCPKDKDKGWTPVKPVDLGEV